MKNKRKIYLAFLKIRKYSIFIALTVFLFALIQGFIQFLIELNNPSLLINPSLLQIIMTPPFLIFIVLTLISIYFFIIGNKYENKKLEISKLRMNRKVESIRKKFIEMNKNTNLHEKVLKMMIFLETIDEVKHYEKEDTDKKP